MEESVVETQALLTDADAKGEMLGGGGELKLGLKELRHVVFDIEEVLNEYMFQYHMNKQRRVHGYGTSGFIDNLTTSVSWEGVTWLLEFKTTMTQSRKYVGDFGLAKVLGRNFSRVLTTMRGTIEYLAPEWISGVPITAKVDVYSYGMMLFEIVSGKRNLDMVDDDMMDYFPARAASKMDKAEEILSLLDHRLEGNADAVELARACKVACWCIQDDEKDRPSMGYVVHVLEGVLNVDTSPVPRFLQMILSNSMKKRTSLALLTSASSQATTDA